CSAWDISLSILF
nr:immunoglobulin light chain junction region [Macaca mulatta]MPO09763.1 immunoglobulin light chain junction region [Macaca mulatta]MPO10375.1 immunoglobulin light chain junction region [Macaca mulatta]MPO10913.1 immunoglobulin light chain junction region [Macaca mulatta]MPO11579.1 immunoglobulin light chain junction region [Macaca mulatta]